MTGADKALADRLLQSVNWLPLQNTQPATNDGIPVATHTGILKIGEHELECFQLSNGQRLISEESLSKFFGADFRTEVLEPAIQFESEDAAIDKAFLSQVETEELVGWVIGAAVYTGLLELQRQGKVKILEKDIPAPEFLAMVLEVGRERGVEFDAQMDEPGFIRQSLMTLGIQVAWLPQPGNPTAVNQQS